MNDPNGLHRSANGTWHMYYQCQNTPFRITDAARLTKRADNPASTTPGNQHWGHATSPNLYSWKEHDIAIYPPDDDSQVYSGSAVLDPENTSGFFPDQKDGVVAIYTLNRPHEQAQAISFSRDGGYTFTPFDGNPVIDLGLADFRDPKVVRYEDHWVMVVAYSTMHKVGIFVSDDLKTWHHASDVTSPDFEGQSCECPCLIKIPPIHSVTSLASAEWTLFVSLTPMADGGRSCVKYAIGTFDGFFFTPHQSSRWLPNDFIGDEYATQYFHGTGEDAVSVSWAKNLKDSTASPTERYGWVSIMTLPRKNVIIRDVFSGDTLLATQPWTLRRVRQRTLGHSTHKNDSINIDCSTSRTGAFCFRTTITSTTWELNAGAAPALHFSVSSSSSTGKVSGGHRKDASSGAWETWVDRSETIESSGKQPMAPSFFSTRQRAMARTISVFFDRSILEMFIDSGERAGTMTFYSPKTLDQLLISTQGFPEDFRFETQVWELGGN